MDNILDIQQNKISSNIKGKIFWFHGEPGTWKTTVASHFPKPFFAGFEIGYQFIDGIYAAPMTTWSDMKDLYRQLRNPKVKEKFETIVFDTISNASTLCYKYALNQLDVSDPAQAAWGQGWRKIKDEWNLIQDIAKLGYCIVFISHSKETEVDVVNQVTKKKEHVVKVKTNMEGWASDVVWGLSDFVFYIRKELEEDGITENCYAYSSLPNVDTKKRHRQFPDRILFSYENIINGLNKIINYEQSKGNSTTSENVREVKENSWTEVRDEVIKLVEELSQTSALSEMTRYITEVFDVRLSETTELYLDKLIAAKDYLKELKEKI